MYKRQEVDKTAAFEGVGFDIDPHAVELEMCIRDRAVTAVLDSITAALVDGDKVALVGFGTFETRKRPARKGRNPRTKEEITIPATVAPAFKAGKALKDAVAK